jgi:hypothetical protein
MSADPTDRPGALVSLQQAGAWWGSRVDHTPLALPTHFLDRPRKAVRTASSAHHFPLPSTVGGIQQRNDRKASGLCPKGLEAAISQGARAHHQIIVEKIGRIEATIREKRVLIERRHQLRRFGSCKPTLKLVPPQNHKQVNVARFSFVGEEGPVHP